MKKPSAYRRLLQYYSTPARARGPAGLLLLGAGSSLFGGVLGLLGGVGRVLGGVGSVFGASRGAGSGSGLVDSRDSSDSFALQGPQQSQGGQEPDDSAGTPVLAGAADSGASGIRAGHTLVVEAERLAGFVRTQTARATPQRIVESLTTLVSTEVLPEGTRLPTVRALAAALRVSPATVSAAYHMLARSGVIHSRGRAGTFVLPQALSEVNIPPASAASFAGGADGWGARTAMPSAAA